MRMAQVYVELLNEGVQVWRPVKAEELVRVGPQLLIAKCTEVELSGVVATGKGGGGQGHDGGQGQERKLAHGV